MNQSGLKFFLVFILLFSSATSIAQLSTPGLSPKVFVYAGYSGYDPGGKSSGVELGRLPHGWNTAAEMQFTPRYAFIADFGNYSGSNVGSTHTYLFGPKFNFHRGPFSPFAQLMMGFQRLSPKSSPSYIAFSEAVGGGLDLAIAHRWSVRVFQADFIYAADHEKGSLPLNQFFGARVSAGLVWNFGKPRKSRETAGKKPTSIPAPSAEPTAAVTKAEPAPATAEVSKTDSAPAATDAPANSAAASTAEIETVSAPSATAKTSTTDPAAASTTPASQPEPNGTSSLEPAKSPEDKEPEATVQPDNKPTAETATAPEPSKAETAPASEKAVAPSPAEAPVAQAAKPDAAPQAAAVPLAQNVVEDNKVLPETKSVEEETSVSKASAQPLEVAKATEPPTAHASSSSSVAPPASLTSIPSVKQIAIVNFPYDQYLTLLSAQDKRTLNAVASRLKLEPESKIVIVGNALRWEGPKTAAQRAVNAKDQLVQKGIAADRVQVFARPLPASRRKYPPAKTEVLFVPAGATFDAASANPVDERQVKPEHLHVAHPDWHEK